jgi:UDP-N-acetylmuramate--alanine ligase
MQEGAFMYQIDFSHPVHVYFVGIGGISMSGLAEILISRGFKVSGSDRQESPVTKRLEEEGVRIFYGQKRENITPDIDVAVFTAAIHPDNPEYIGVQELSVPMLTRAQLLGQVMKQYDRSIAISGTHGKTTTTSMISEILLEANADPTLSIGGILKDIGGNVRVGKSDCFVAEACEYTNSFLSLWPKTAIILDIDADHLDFFKDLADIRHSFHTFAQQVSPDGTLILNGDIENRDEITEGVHCKVVTYGSDSSSDYYPTDIVYDRFAHPSYTLHSRDAKTGKERTDAVVLSVPGEHNVLNSMAALAAADLFGIDRGTSLRALKKFTGTDRRFEFKGSRNGFDIIDDYAHHPTEIRATLCAAEKVPHDRIWCVFQPHTFTRTKALMHEFAEALCLADRVVLADIYPARETDDLGISSRTLQKEILDLGHPCDYFDSFAGIEKFLLENCHKNDLLITMGAGNVEDIAEDLLS